MLCPFKEAAILDASLDSLPVDLDSTYSGSVFLSQKAMFLSFRYLIQIKGQRPCVYYCVSLNGLNAPA